MISGKPSSEFFGGANLMKLSQEPPAKSKFLSNRAKIIRNFALGWNVGMKFIPALTEADQIALEAVHHTAKTHQASPSLSLCFRPLSIASESSKAKWLSAWTSVFAKPAKSTDCI